MEKNITNKTAFFHKKIAMTDSEPLINKITNFGKSVFTLATSQRKDVDVPPKVVAISDVCNFLLLFSLHVSCILVANIQ